MFGAILGDMVGSPYEFDSNNIKSKDFPLFSRGSTYTDDTVLTLAIGQALMECPDPADDALVSAYYTRELHRLGNRFPDAGYGYRFAQWLKSNDPKPYHSYGNGAAMRVSAVGRIGRDLSEVRRLARLSAAVTHDHPEGIKGAEAVACAIFLARQGQSKDAIRHYISAEFGYDLSQSCAEIRPHYHHVESCQETVPQAFAAFFEGGSFEDVLRTAVSLGGDSDTLAAIAASIAEAYYGIDEDWKKAALSRLPEELAQILRRFDLIYGDFEPCRTNKLHEAINFAEKAHRGQKRKGTEIAYITHPLEVMQILTSMQVSDDLLIAGVLHDTVEDTAVTIEDIRAAFGDRAAFLVGAHSEDKSKTWRERKQHTLDALKTAERDVKLLVLADKVANLRSMLDDHRQIGERLWERFNAPKAQQAWYNGALQDVLLDLQDDPAARNIYWEMVDICKDLFAEYYADRATRTIYQAYCDGQTYVFCAANNKWEPYSGVIPPAAVRLPRLKAERLEDYWRSERPAESAVTFDLGDITTLSCDCIVNAANNSLLGGGGVDGAIHRAAGPGLLAECRRLNGCATGEAKLTQGYDLPARYVIHTVGPRYTGNKNDAHLLAACYRNSLDLAKAHDLHSIAFPAISAGAYGYPLKEAAAIAIKTVNDWLKANPAYGMEVIFSCYDRRTFQTYRDIFYGLSE